MLREVYNYNIFIQNLFFIFFIQYTLFLSIDFQNY